MNRLLAWGVILVTVVALPAASPAQGIRFVPLDVIVESEAALAAYQIEVVAEGNAQIVGVEGGEHAAFAKPPYYDPKALMGGRIVVAALSTSDALPTGKTRIVTLHVREEGPAPMYRVRVVKTVGPLAKPVVVRATINPRSGVAR